MNYEYVIIRPNIEHEMLGIILGRGGSEELGATLWGQTELSCYDDSQHGVWGMSYKYHERAQVFNERNMVRLWDIAFDGYNGGMDDQVVNWDTESMEAFRKATSSLQQPYSGGSYFVMRFLRSRNRTPSRANWPSPIVFFDDTTKNNDDKITCDPECIHDVADYKMRVFNDDFYRSDYEQYRRKMPNFGKMHTIRKQAGIASAADETTSLSKLAFQGSLRAMTKQGTIVDLQTGCGHLGPSYVGIASIRDGKGYKLSTQPTLGRLV
jgi:hypothetical protein